MKARVPSGSSPPARLRNREELTELSPDRLFGYSSLSGLPIRDHQASIRLEPAADGTLITWQEKFETTWPGSAWFLDPVVA